MLIQPTSTICMVVDIQEKLLPHIKEHEELLQNMIKLIQGLKLLDIPFILNEQYPQGIGKTVKEISEQLDGITPFEKVTFSCCGNDTTRQHILKSKKNSAIVFGIEAHVCVMQTCLDLLSNNITPIIVTDCIGSRKQKDCDIAIMRLVQTGAVPVTYESLLFELCKTSLHPNFKEISAIIK